MPATIVSGLASFGPLLKEFYQGPIANQLNERVWMREYFQKKSKGWSGSEMVIPVHTARNTGVGFIGESPALLPLAGQQGYADLRVFSRNSYGRFQVSGQAMDTATKGGVGAFAGVMNEEMDRLVRDIVNNENYMGVFGGNVKGLLNQRQAGTATPALVQDATVIGSFSVAQVWQYQGDFSYFDGTRTGQAVVAANTATWIKVDLINLDTYATVNWFGASDNVMVTAFNDNRTNPTITLRYGDDSGGAQNFDLTTVLNDAAIGVRISDARADAPLTSGLFGQDPAVWAGPGTAGPQNVIVNQPNGLFGNLCEPTHFGVDRTTATGTADILQSTIVTHGLAAAGGLPAGDRGLPSADLSLERLQYMFDVLQQDAGVDANVMVMNALMRHRYTVQLTGIMGTQNNVFVNGDSGKLQENQQNLAYGGVKFQYDRTFPICTIAMLHSDAWLLAELTTGQFADEDGNVLFRVAGQDAYEGFWKHRYNIACKRPNAQVILTGITPT